MGVWAGDQLGQDNLLGAFKNLTQRRFDLILSGQLDFQGIHVPVIFVQLKVEVGSSAPA